MGATTYDFSDETAIVTGGASGIDQAVALRFGEAGATVIIADIREQPKEEGESTPTHEPIGDSSGRPTFIETDTSSRYSSGVGSTEVSYIDLSCTHSCEN